MTHLWDTDTSVYYLNGNEKIARKMTECGLSNICVTSVTVAELIFGAYNSQRIEANLARVDKFREQIIVLKTMTHEILDYFGKNKAF